MGISEKNTELIYKDVNGDGAEDLVVVSFRSVTVLLWTNDHYSNPFIDFEGPPLNLLAEDRGGGSRVLLEDWTGDGVPEVVLDRYSSYYHHWTRQIYYCKVEGCVLVWKGTLVNIYWEKSGGLFVKIADLQRDKDWRGTPILKYLNTVFSVDQNTYYASRYFSITTTPSQYDPKGLYVSPKILVTYRWTGSVFELAGSEVYTNEYYVPSLGSMTTTNSQGDTANVKMDFRDPSQHRYGSNLCQVEVNSRKIGAVFSCTQNFTSVEWKDITNDGDPELLVRALSSPYRNDGTFLTSKQCPHRELIVYRWRANTATEIANVIGCVVQEDLYGVRLEDLDHDGIVEIIAADRIEKPSGTVRINTYYKECYLSWCRDEWYDFNRNAQIYKWNGVIFSYWEDLLK
jgi:hypothetical protein